MVIIYTHVRIVIQLLYLPVIVVWQLEDKRNIIMNNHKNTDSIWTECTVNKTIQYHFWVIALYSYSFKHIHFGNINCYIIQRLKEISTRKLIQRLISYRMFARTHKLQFIPSFSVLMSIYNKIISRYTCYLEITFMSKVFSV